MRKIIKEKKVKKCELCNCEVDKSFITYDFDFCFGCINGGGKCKKCATKPVLNQLTKLRLKSESLVITANWNLEDAEELREMTKELKPKSKKLVRK